MKTENQSKSNRSQLSEPEKNNAPCCSTNDDFENCCSESPQNDKAKDHSSNDVCCTPEIKGKPGCC